MINLRPPQRSISAPRERGSVLVIVLWISLGLVTLALYFAHSTSLALKSADQRSAGIEADQAIEGATRYVSYVLANLEEPGLMPSRILYRNEAELLGDATFWILGRNADELTPTLPYFALVDEGSKLNLNTATLEMLQALPLDGMAQVAAAILDWRDTDSDIRSDGGAEDETYLRLNPPYHCKNGKFETVEELKLVQGITTKLLYGEDTNRNGILDPNENDGESSPPYDDNHDGKLDPGLLEYVTVYSRASNTRTNGQQKVNVTGTGVAQRAASLFQEKFGTDRGNQILRQLPANTNARSVLEFYVRSRMTADEFALVAQDITSSNGQFQEGLVNVNTASEAVLTCIPGIGSTFASQLVNYRKSNPDKLKSMVWVLEVMDQGSAFRAAPYITAYTYQFTADIAATGHMGRGYRRWQVVFDTSEGTPRAVYRRDLSHLGWALGRQVRQQQQQQQLARSIR